MTENEMLDRIAEDAKNYAGFTPGDIFHDKSFRAGAYAGYQVASMRFIVVSLIILSISSLCLLLTIYFVL